MSLNSIPRCGLSLLALASCLPTFAQIAASAPNGPAPSAFAAAAAKEAGAVVTASGLVFRSTAPGAGDSPTASDNVKVHYRGTLLDGKDAGKEFDSSFKRGEPATFPLNRVIPCWTEGVQRMRPGGKAVLTCPPEIAYGARGAGGVIPPNATLRFEIELISVVKP